MVEAAERRRTRQHVVAAAGVLALHALLLAPLLYRAAPEPHPSAPALVTVDLSLREKPARKPEPMSEPKPQPVKLPQPVVKRASIPKPVVPRSAPPSSAPEMHSSSAAQAPAAATAPGGAVAQSSAVQSSAVREDYETKLRAWLAAHKRYPVQAKRMRLEGSALLQLTVGPEGQVVAYRIEQSSGSVILDREVGAMLVRSEPLPAPPAGIAGAELEFRFYIHFNLGELD